MKNIIIKKHHYYIIGVVILEALFLSVTHFYTNYKEARVRQLKKEEALAAKKISEAKRLTCEDYPFGIRLDDSYFAIRTLNGDTLNGNVRYKGLNLSFEFLKKVPRNLAEKIGMVNCINRILFTQNHIKEFP